MSLLNWLYSLVSKKHRAKLIRLEYDQGWELASGIYKLEGETLASTYSIVLWLESSMTEEAARGAIAFCTSMNKLTGEKL